MKMKAIFADLFKPIQTAFLVLSGLISYTVSSDGSPDWRVLLMLTFSLYFTISGTTGLNMYLDRDIDSMMERTKKRALPSRKLNEGDAVYASALFLSIGLLLFASINWGVFIAGLLGAIVDLAIYTRMLKRRTPPQRHFREHSWGNARAGGLARTPQLPHNRRDPHSLSSCPMVSEPHMVHSLILFGGLHKGQSPHAPRSCG
ncbi:protoheme IX farnesyltransferase [Fervidicoccus fontis Kam940]|uniref:heme o synthase n=1 Tax=Fervidicoccus fontis (strain DSM 19380 / JCM 18336 / VKM B-2539 / Kam940) TaxID=1163730 RepID=I0A102_FERFK|nr:protoheme IX farnesyltransferase [Fervidicoccus fontis Kam940]